MPIDVHIIILAAVPNPAMSLSLQHLQYLRHEQRVLDRRLARIKRVLEGVVREQLVDLLQRFLVALVRHVWLRQQQKAEARDGLQHRQPKRGGLNVLDVVLVEEVDLVLGSFHCGPLRHYGGLEVIDGVEGGSEPHE